MANLRRNKWGGIFDLDNYLKGKKLQPPTQKNVKELIDTISYQLTPEAQLARKELELYKNKQEAEQALKQQEVRGKKEDVSEPDREQRQLDAIVAQQPIAKLQMKIHSLQQKKKDMSSSYEKSKLESQLFALTKKLDEMIIKYNKQFPDYPIRG